MRLGAGVVEAPGDRDTDVVRWARIETAEIALFKIDTFSFRIQACAHRYAVDRYSLVISGCAGGNYDRVNYGIVSRHAKEPGAISIGCRLQCRAHGKLVAARLNLKRHDETLPPDVPIESEVRAVDAHVESVVGPIDDHACIGDQLTLHRLRQAFAGNLGTNACRYGNVNIEIAGVEPQRQEDIACRNTARLDSDRAHSIGKRAHCRAQYPRTLRRLGLKSKNNAALAGPRQAHIDAFELPLPAIAPIIDNQVAVL